MFYTQSYKHIINLRNEHDAPKRGYIFEQLLRELLPWTFRPPISISTRSEQIDAFFEWNSWHFLVEAKAKAGTITAGSHDWEDFALKIRKRKGQCIGLFCSLNEVNDEVIREGEHLNREGYITVLITGEIWDDLLSNSINISDYMRYMVFHAKSKYHVQPKSMVEINKWSFDREDTNKKINSFCLKESSVFLRRHKLNCHDSIYVSRKIDGNILSYVSLLKPSKLNEAERIHKHDGKEYSIERRKPKQFVVIRDWSGAGKTTLAVNLATEHSQFYGATKAALQNDIDGFIDALSNIDDECGIVSLVNADKPIILTIDSLDEAIGIGNKHREIGALIKGVDQLNKEARLHGLLCYPIMLVFTIREDFWREWEASFEGLSSYNVKKRFSEFNPEETRIALKKYSESYSFRVVSSLTQAQLKVLSHPFNLQIFSEAHEYDGNVETDNILNETVLNLYFDRKKDDVLKRPIPGFSPTILLPLCSDIAERVAVQCKNSIPYDQVISIIKKSYPSLSNVADLIVHNLVSEQILVKDSLNPSFLRFRHMKFVEYLSSFYIARKLNESDDPRELDHLVSRIINDDFLSLYYIHEFIRFICRLEFPETYKTLTDYYANSSSYMKKLVHTKRLLVSCGSKVSNLDIDTIEKSMGRGESEVCWEGFFVISAKNNKQNKKIILNAFVMAWKSNETNPDRWKLLNKISQHKLLLEDSIISSVLSSNSTSDWYALIDGIIIAEQFDEFKEVLDEYGASSIFNMLEKRGDYGWPRVAKLLKLAYRGKGYELGEE